MKGFLLALVGILLFSCVGYLGIVLVNKHIDSVSGAIVEKTLSENTIRQLVVLSEIQSQIDSGNFEQARSKIAETVRTLKYILEHNCDLPECKEAIARYEGE